jgi:hypothetical protein
MNALEEKDAVYNGRTRKAEQAAATCDVTTAEIRDLKTRLKAFEEDSHEQEKDQLVSKILAEQTRDTAILKDKMKRMDGLVLDYRTQQEDFEELRQKLGVYTKTIKGLETKLMELEKSLSIIDDANAIRDAAARLKYLESRDGTQNYQLRSIQLKLDALGLDCKAKTTEIDRLRVELAKAKGEKSIERTDAPEIQVLQSPEVVQR